MASEPLRPPFAGRPVLRLAGQLQGLSELTESLAFRLLELEERLAALELRLQPLLQASDLESSDGADTELRLDDTEERLARLESLLNGLEGSGAARQGANVLPLPRFDADAQSGADAQDELIPHPDSDLPEELFYEEDEQPFMDEETFPDDSRIDDTIEADGLSGQHRLSA